MSPTSDLPGGSFAYGANISVFRSNHSLFREYRAMQTPYHEGGCAERVLPVLHDYLSGGRTLPVCLQVERATPGIGEAPEVGYTRLDGTRGETHMYVSRDGSRQDRGEHPQDVSLVT